MQAGDKISFGKYNWIGLDVQNDRALIITEHIIEQRPYHDAYAEITWADCALRKYILKGNIADGKCTGGVRPALWLKL